MALKVLNRFPGANARVLTLRTEGSEPEMVFAAEPRGGAALWFHFRLEDAAPPQPPPATLTLTLRYFETLVGGDDPMAVRPVTRESGKNWFRLKPPTVSMQPDGQRTLSWTLSYPVVNTEIAFCYPYYRDELASFLGHGKGYWREDDIGLTGAGRIQTRLRNAIAEGCDACPHPRGLYAIARRQAGETPGAWVLDGLLSAISRAKPVNWCVWAVPFADLDGVAGGWYGGGPGPQGDVVLQRDLQRWAGRCTPELLLDLRAQGASAAEGVRIRGLSADSAAEGGKGVQAWMNVFREALRPDYAAEPFVVEDDAVPPQASGWLPALPAGCSVLSVEIPYAQCGDLLLMPKQYREIGQRLARAILTRR